MYGDRPRNRQLVDLAHRLEVGVVATGDVHYHVRSRHLLQDALVAIKHRTTLDQSHRQRRAKGDFRLRPPQVQERRFAEFPQALRGTAEVAGRCEFDLTQDLGYRLPGSRLPPGHTDDSWLAEVCLEALSRRYAESERGPAEEHLKEELALIARHKLAGFFLTYREVLQLATEVAA